VAQYHVMRIAHEAGVKVLLDGQGADELLGGYVRYTGTRFGGGLRSGNPARIWGAARGIAGGTRPAQGLPGVRRVSANRRLPATPQPPEDCRPAGSVAQSRRAARRRRAPSPSPARCWPGRSGATSYRTTCRTSSDTKTATAWPSASKRGRRNPDSDMLSDQ